MPIDPTTLHLHRTGQGTPLLLLHGLGQDRHVWNAMPGLSDMFEILTCDLPGHGDAPPALTSYGIEDLSEALAIALRRAGVTKTHVAGHDLGGMLAQHLAASEPGLVDRLVLISTTPTYHDDDQAAWLRNAALVRQAGLASLPWLRHSTAICSAEGIAQACEALAAVDLIDLAGEIFARTLILVGDGDSFAYRDAADWLARGIAGAKLAFVPDTEHVPLLEQPRWTEQALRAFLG